MNTNFTIAKKLILGFGLLTAFVLLSSILTYTTLNKNRNINERINNVYTPSVSYLNDLYFSVYNSKMLLKNWVFIERKSDTPDKLALKNIHAVDFPRIKGELDKISTNWLQSEQDEYKYIVKSIQDTLFEKQKSVMATLHSFDIYDDPSIVFEIYPLVQEGGEITVTGDRILKHLTALLEQHRKYATEGSNTMEKSFDSFQWFIFLMGFISIVLAVIIASWITLNIRRSLKEASTVIAQLAQGDLTVQIKVSSKDEIGTLLEDIEEMVVRLREIVANVINGSDNVASASIELNESSQRMSEGANQQASSAEEVSSSMEEMASNIQQNTENAQQTEKIALKAAQDIQEGSKAVNTTVDSMKLISEKVTIIGEIARQTNILALNAAIEAARAGEHGKGFAVVAAEVRKLAERSQIAANEINEISRSSVDIAEESRKVLEEIVPQIGKTAKLVQEISAASIEQNSGADQVNNAIQHLNQIIQENASTSEQMAANSESLSKEANQLREIISFFKID